MTILKLPTVDSRRGQNNAPMAASASLKAIDVLIGNVRRGYENSDARVQRAGLLILEHALTYGDCDRARKLARAVPSRLRNSLIGWFGMFSPIGILMGKAADEDKCRFLKPESKAYNAFNIPGAKAQPWYDDPAKVNPEPKALNTAFDFFAVIDKMLERAISDAALTGEKAKYVPDARDEVHADAQELRALVSRFRAKKLAAKQAATSDEDTSEIIDVAATMVG